MRTVPFSQVPLDPQLKDVLDELRRTIFLDLQCHHIGTIQSFNAESQTATVTINYKKTFYRLDEKTKTYLPVLVDYPVLVDSPVICLGGAQASLTFPIAQEDECLVLFNDRDLDSWLQAGGGGPVNTPRAHSFADGVILVGLRSAGKVIADYDPTRASLRNGAAVVAVGTELIKVANQDFTLNNLLQALISNIQELVGNVGDLVAETAAITVTAVTPGPGLSGPPANAGAISAISADLIATANDLTATANDIAGLLE